MKVPIGITAANKQSPLIVHVDYEMCLPDHDFVKSSKHKLTLSVYSACEICTTSSKVALEISYQVQLILLFAVVNTTPVSAKPRVYLGIQFTCVTLNFD